MSDFEKKYEKELGQFLNSKRINDVRYMTQKEAQEMGWFSRPLIIFFEGGGFIYASADDEGNDGGAMFTSDKNNPVIPVMR